MSSELDRLPLQTFVRRWWVVVGFVSLFGAAGGSAAVLSIETTYEASTQILVGPLVADAEALEGSSRLARTYSDLLASRTFVREASKRVGVPAGSSQVVATSRRGSAILDLVVRAPGADDAVRLSDELIGELRSMISRSSAPIDFSDLDPTTAGVAELVRTGGSVTELGDTRPGAQRTIPVPVGAAAGGIGGFLFGTSLALTIERRKRRIAVLAAGSGIDVHPLDDLDVVRRRWGSSPPHVFDGPSPLLDLVVPLEHRPILVLVTCPDERTAYVDAALQLVSGLGGTGWMVDAHGLVWERLHRGRSPEPLGAPKRFSIGDDTVWVSSPLVGPHARPVNWFDSDTDFGDDPPRAVVLFAPATEYSVVWQRCAWIADAVVVMTVANADASTFQALLRRAERSGIGELFHVGLRRHIGRAGTYRLAQDGAERDIVRDRVPAGHLEVS